MASVKMKVSEEGLEPTQGKEGDAGYDLRASEDVTIAPGESAVVGTGVSISLPYGFYAMLTHRSSLAFKGGSVLSLGIIDSNYKGEMKALIFNHGYDHLYLKKGDRFCQFIINRYYEDDFEIVEEFDEQGKDGFGSSGTD